MSQYLAMISDSEINITGAHFANLPCLPNISTVFTAEIFKRCTETFSLSNEPLTTSLPVVEFSAKAPDTNNFNLCRIQTDLMELEKEKGLLNIYPLYIPIF